MVGGFLIEQGEFARLGLLQKGFSIVDAALLTYLQTKYWSRNTIKINNSVTYRQYTPEEIVEDMPLLQVDKKAALTLMNRLKNFGVIDLIETTEGLFYRLLDPTESVGSNTDSKTDSKEV